MNTIDKIAFMATVLLSRHINIGTEQVKEAVACAADILASSAKLVLQKTHPMVDPAQSVDRVLDMSIMEFFSKESLMAVGATNYTATRVLSVIIGAMKKKEDPDYSAARKVSMRSFLEEMKNVSRIRGMGRKSIEAMFALLKKHDYHVRQSKSNSLTATEAQKNCSVPAVFLLLFLDYIHLTDAIA